MDGWGLSSPGGGIAGLATSAPGMAAPNLRLGERAGGWLGASLARWLLAPRELMGLPTGAPLRTHENYALAASAHRLGETATSIVEIAGASDSSGEHGERGEHGEHDDGAEGEPLGLVSPDEAASAAARSGDRLPRPSTPLSPLERVASYEAFFQRHERDIFSYLWRVTGDEQTAYDLRQETFLRAWNHYDQLLDYTQPAAWLFRVATNLAINHLRRRKAPVGAAAPLDLVGDPGMSDPSWRLVESDLVRQTLLALPPRQRAALVLREVYGLSCEEIARSLGVTPAAVRMTLWRGREQFRALYTKANGGFSGRRAQPRPAPKAAKHHSTTTNNSPDSHDSADPYAITDEEGDL